MDTNNVQFNLNLLTTNNPVFCCFLFWTSILVIKMLLMTLLTAFQRFRNKIFGLLPESLIRKAFPNQEDIVFKDVEVKFDDPEVERVRRAHRNDMENILPYFTMSLAYLTIDPNPSVACTLFRIVAVLRILHTLVYAVYPMRQPTRAIVFFICYGITLYMAIAVFFKTIKYI